jgi:DNA modification methylase
VEKSSAGLGSMINKIFNEDCLETMRRMPDKGIDLILTDPPYGINADKGFSGSGGFGGSGKPIKRRAYIDVWDNKRPDEVIFKEIIRVSKLALIFGGNYFADILPQGTHWLVWDKMNTMPTFSDCELIWSNSKRKSVKIIKHEWNGLIGKESTRFHPTQKPVELIAKILNKYSKKTDLVYDPFMGSGTTALACIKAGNNYIGSEISKEYCDIAEKRIKQELSQMRLF